VIFPLTVTGTQTKRIQLTETEKTGTGTELPSVEDRATAIANMYKIFVKFGHLVFKIPEPDSQISYNSLLIVMQSVVNVMRHNCIETLI